MSLPLIGASISVTSTAENGEIGKFFGTYSPENGQFVLRPLPGKRYIQQFPMFMEQGFGWDYEIFILIKPLGVERTLKQNLKN